VRCNNNRAATQSGERDKGRKNKVTDEKNKEGRKKERQKEKERERERKTDKRTLINRE